MNFIKQFKSLPSGTRKLMSLGIIIGLTVALPLFIWALVNLNFNQKEKASSGEPVLNPINWTTADVSITADDFKITSNNKIYTGGPNDVIINPKVTTPTTAGIEVISNAYGDTVKLNVNFKANGSTWWVEDVKVFNSNYSNDWITFTGPFISTALGHSFHQNGSNSMVLMDPNTGHEILQLDYSNLTVHGFTRSTPPPTACQPFPMTITTPDNSKDGEINQTLKYDINIKHNDPNCLGGINVNLSAHVLDGWSVVFVNNNFHINSNETYSTSFYVTATSGKGDTPVTITATSLYPDNTAVFNFNYNVIVPDTIDGDVNGDGVVNIVDLGILIDFYGQSNPSYPKADLNGDGVVNIVDIGIVIDNY